MLAWLLLLHAAALTVVALLPLPLPASLALVVAVLLSLAWHWRTRVSSRYPHAVRGLRWEADAECVLQLASGELLTARLAAHAFVMPWLVILYFHGRPRHLVLLPDMLAAQAFRQLRVRLRLELQQNPQPGA
jgi:Membrane-bound toxin component of toxin-antitoxin system